MKLIKINERKVTQDNEATFDVEFEIKFKDGSGSGLTDGSYNWSYELRRDNGNSPWIIYNYGGG